MLLSQEVEGEEEEQRREEVFHLGVWHHSSHQSRIQVE
jgi:hypothetical protein